MAHVNLFCHFCRLQCLAAKDHSDKEELQSQLDTVLAEHTRQTKVSLAEHHRQTKVSVEEYNRQSKVSLE